MSKTTHELNVRTSLDKIQNAVETKGDAGAGPESFCATYKFSRIDFGNAAEVRNIQPPLGYQFEIVSILLYDVTEVFDSAETIDIGIDGGDTDAYVDGATLATGTAVGDSIRATIVDGVTGHDAGANTGAELAITTSTVGTTGIGSLAITFRFFR